MPMTEAERRHDIGRTKYLAREREKERKYRGTEAEKDRALRREERMAQRGLVRTGVGDRESITRPKPGVGVPGAAGRAAAEKIAARKKAGTVLAFGRETVREKAIEMNKLITAKGQARRKARIAGGWTPPKLDPSIVRLEETPESRAIGMRPIPEGREERMDRLRESYRYQLGNEDFIEGQVADQLAAGAATTRQEALRNVLGAARTQGLLRPAPGGRESVMRPTAIGQPPAAEPEARRPEAAAREPYKGADLLRAAAPPPRQAAERPQPAQAAPMMVQPVAQPVQPAPMAAQPPGVMPEMRGMRQEIMRPEMPPQVAGLPFETRDLYTEWGQGTTGAYQAPTPSVLPPQPPMAPPTGGVPTTPTPPAPPARMDVTRPTVTQGPVAPAMPERSLADIAMESDRMLAQRRPEAGMEGWTQLPPTPQQQLGMEEQRERIRAMRQATELVTAQGMPQSPEQIGAREGLLRDMPDLTGGIGFTQGPSVGAGRMDQAYTWIENALAGAPTAEERGRIASTISNLPRYLEMVKTIEDLQDFGPIEDVLEYSMPAVGAKPLAREWIQKMIRIRDLVKSNIKSNIGIRQ